jgi:acid phosphatase family membrane protein YuiD
MEETMNYWDDILGNQVLVSAVAAWMVAQFLKTLIDMALNKNFNPERLVGSGGMPSSHSSTVCALTTAASYRYGVGSFEFAICFVLSMIVMYDAMGVRRETGKQAKLLNSILLENPLKLKGELIQETLKEYVGHTPLQVAAGALLGILLALFISQFY